MATKILDISLILTDIRKHNFSPVYFLHGDEPYYIDRISDALVKSVFNNEEEKDFDFIQYYGADVSVKEVVSACRRFPMMSKYQLVILKEAQMLDARSNNLEDLQLYLEHPLQSTILLVTYKGKSYDSRKKIMKTISEIGVVFESKKKRDYELPKLITENIKARKLEIDDNAVALLCNSIGGDLTRMFSEIDKLCLSIKSRKINVEDVSSVIGISKEYNIWELISAIANRDMPKIDAIQKYFEKNPKAMPFVVILSMLFNFFSNLMLAHYSDDKSEQGLMKALKLPNFYAAKDYKVAMKIYNAWKTMINIAIIREYDAMNKGTRGTFSLSESDLLKELLFKLSH